MDFFLWLITVIVRWQVLIYISSFIELHAAASVLADWNVIVVNKTTSSVAVSWNSTASLLKGGIQFYFALARKINSSNESISEIGSGNVTALEINGLEDSTEYNVTVVAVTVDGTPFKSAEVLASTVEGERYIYIYMLKNCVKYIHRTVGKYEEEGSEVLHIKRTLDIYNLDTCTKYPQILTCHW